VTANPNTPFSNIPPPLGAKLPGTETRPAPIDPQESPDTSYTRLELWLHRNTVLLFVFLCASTGVLLVILPWRPEWTDNQLLQGFPELRAIVGSGFVRGVVSGLGALDTWIGFWEAVHYHEHKGS